MIAGANWLAEDEDLVAVWEGRLGVFGDVGVGADGFDGFDFTGSDVGFRTGCGLLR